jgi:hypothetical protein
VLQSDSLLYLHLTPGSMPPDIVAAPTRMVVVVEADVSPAWQALVSHWIIQSGCLYMMAWGIDCSAWDDSVDYANMDQHDNLQIPEDGSVVTTWHPDEPMAEVFWYSKNLAKHSSIDIERTVILDISTSNRRDQLLQAYISA